MIVWPFLVTCSVAVVAATAISRDGRMFRCAYLILLGFVGARVIMALPISGEYRDVVFAGMWVGIATLMPLVRSVFAIRLSVMGCGLCSLWGEFTGATMHLGSPPYMTADALLTAAMLMTGWSVRNEFTDRIRDILHRHEHSIYHHHSCGGGDNIMGRGVQDSIPSKKVKGLAHVW